MRIAAFLLVAAASLPLHAQVSPDVEALVDRLGRYLVDYETQLSTVVAEERYRQSEVQLRPGAPRETGSNTIFRTRALESEVAFLRLPGNAEWFGVRHVRRVDGRRVAGETENLWKIVTSRDVDLAARIRAIVGASSRHNLGSARTINMPTVPLELLHPKHRQRFAFTQGSTTTIERTRVHELRYRELKEPSLILGAKGIAMLAQGSVWVGSDGRVLRVTLRLAHADQFIRKGRTSDNELRVDFATNEALGMVVPRVLHEDFEIAGGGRFQGRATYSNFRRFTTSARILPPP
jgi:hypothetical protein